MTREEVQSAFLNYVRARVEYWATLPADQNRSGQDEARWRTSGVAFSILVLLDGGTGLPGFLVAPNPHPSNHAFFAAEGDNWYPENNPESVAADIAGDLHERFHQ